ncbi:hypothetical protein GCM10027081_63820 [Cupriavidus yeoncheonensis]
MIAMSHATGMRTLIDQHPHQTGVPVNPRSEVEYLSTAVGLAQAGLGIAIVPAYVGKLPGSDRTICTSPWYTARSNWSGEPAAC